MNVLSMKIKVEFKRKVISQGSFLAFFVKNVEFIVKISYNTNIFKYVLFFYFSFMI